MSIHTRFCFVSSVGERLLLAGARAGGFGLVADEFAPISPTKTFYYPREVILKRARFYTLF